MLLTRDDVRCGRNRGANCCSLCVGKAFRERFRWIGKDQKDQKDSLMLRSNSFELLCNEVLDYL